MERVKDICRLYMKAPFEMQTGEMNHLDLEFPDKGVCLSVLYRILGNHKGLYAAEAVAMAFDTRQDYERFFNGAENGNGTYVYIADEDDLYLLSDVDAAKGDVAPIFSDHETAMGTESEMLGECRVIGSEILEDGRYLVSVEPFNPGLKRLMLVANHA